MEYQQSVEQLQLTNAENTLKTHKLTLNQLLEIKADSTVDFVSDVNINIVEEDSLNPDSVYKMALEFLPEFKSHEAYINSCRIASKISASNAYPRLSLAYSFDKNYNKLNGDFTIPQQLSKSYYGMLGLKLDIPIFNGLNIKYNKTEASINLSEAELGLESLKKNLYMQIQRLYLDYASAKEKYKMQQKSKDYANKSYAFAEKQIQEGVINILEYNIEKNNLIKAETDLTTSKYDLIFKRKILDYYMGRSMNPK